MTESTLVALNIDFRPGLTTIAEEAENLNGQCHPHIVQLLGVVMAGTYDVMVLEPP